VPVHAIKVPLVRTLQVKKNEDFGKMKNLFLANCLKHTSADEFGVGFLESTMSKRIQANRGGRFPLELQPSMKKC